MEMLNKPVTELQKQQIKKLQSEISSLEKQISVKLWLISVLRSGTNLEDLES